MRSLNGAYKKGLQKKSTCKYANSIQKFTTCVDHLLDNHVVISENPKSCYWKTSAQSSQKMGFRKITLASLQKHFLLISCLMIDTYVLGLFCLAYVALVRTENCMMQGQVQKYVRAT